MEFIATTYLIKKRGGWITGQMWVEKHKPKAIDEFNAGRKAVEYLKEWDGSPLILHGAPGVGKTLLAQLAALYRGWELVELTRENLGESQAIIESQSLFGGKKLIVIEDIDEFRGTARIKQAIQNTRNPILLTTREYSSKKLAPLKKLAGDLQLRRPVASSIAKRLAAICEAEGVDAEREILKEIGKNSAGDYRAAINDLEMLCAGRTSLDEQDLELLAARDRKKDIYSCLSQVFGGRDLLQVRDSTWNLSEQPRDVLFWIDENMPHLYRDNDSRNRAIRNLARADVFLGRIMSRQYWGYLRYTNALMTGGVNAERPEKVNYTQYRFPKYWIAMGRTKKKRNIEKSIAEKLSPLLHVSSKIISEQYIPLFKKLAKQEKIGGSGLEEYGLEPDEIAYITG